MANEQNLRPSEHVFTQEEAKRGGIASGKARRERRSLMELANMLLESDIINKETGETVTKAEALLLAQMAKAMKGDTKAFIAIRDTAGQAPTSKMEVSTKDQAKVTELLEQWREARK